MLHVYIYNAMLLLFYQVAESGKKHTSTIFWKKDLGSIQATKKNNSHQWTAYAEC